MVNVLDNGQSFHGCQKLEGGSRRVRPQLWLDCRRDGRDSVSGQESPLRDVELQGESV